MEFVEVRKMALALGYLDDQWMRVRQEAKRQGVVLGYHRVSEVQLAGPGSTAGDANSIVLLTEYKILSAFSGREVVFASIRFETRGFMEQPANPDAAQFKLIVKK